MKRHIDYNNLWSEYWGDVQRYGPSHRIHRYIMLKVLKEIQFRNVLEVGCGNGMNLFALHSLRPFLGLSASDISRVALSNLKKILPDVKTYEFDITKSYLPETFDLILCFDVLEHLDDDESAINNMVKITNKYLFVSTLQGKMRKFEKHIGHVRNYQRGELQHKLIKSGLTICRVIEWGHPFFSPLFRNYLDYGGQKQTTGKYGFLRRNLCHLIYGLFKFNSYKRGDMLFVLARK